MSLIRMAETTEPATPPSGKIYVWYNAADSVWKYKDDTGAVFPFSAGVFSVNGEVGNVVLDKADIGLGNVDNTSDANKPISTATQTALDGKQPIDSDLTAIAAVSTNGLLTRTGSGTVVTRSVVAGTGVSVSNGDGLSGDPTVSLPNVGTAGSKGSATQVPVFTTDAQGRVTANTDTNIAIPLSQITQSGAATNQVPQWSGSAWVPVTFTGSNLPTITSAARLSLTPVQGQQVYDTDLNAVCTFVSPSWIYETAVRSTSITSTTNNFFGSVPDLTSPSLEVGFYQFIATIIVQSTSGLNGLGIRLSSVTATANVLAQWSIPASSSMSNDAFTEWLQEANSDDASNGSPPFTNQDYIVHGSGIVQITSAGTVAIGLRSENFGTSVSVRERSILVLRKVN